jgi:hypothetical protein
LQDLFSVLTDPSSFDLPPILQSQTTLSLGWMLGVLEENILRAVFNKSRKELKVPKATEDKFKLATTFS